MKISRRELIKMAGKLSVLGVFPWGKSDNKLDEVKIDDSYKHNVCEFHQKYPDVTPYMMATGKTNCIACIQIQRGWQLDD